MSFLFHKEKEWMAHKQHIVKIPSKISFRFACGALENVDQRWVILPLSLVGRLSKDYSSANNFALVTRAELTLCSF